MTSARLLPMLASSHVCTSCINQRKFCLHCVAFPSSGTAVSTPKRMSRVVQFNLCDCNSASQQSDASFASQQALIDQKRCSNFHTASCLASNEFNKHVISNRLHSLRQFSLAQSRCPTSNSFISHHSSVAVSVAACKSIAESREARAKQLLSCV